MDRWQGGIQDSRFLGNLYDSLVYYMIYLKIDRYPTIRHPTIRHLRFGFIIGSFDSACKLPRRGPVNCTIFDEYKRTVYRKQRGEGIDPSVLYT